MNLTPLFKKKSIHSTKSVDCVAIKLTLFKHKKQKGYILLLTMILLIMITVLALANVSLNTTQIRIAANATDTEMSLEKTEGALNEAINKLLNGTYTAANFLQNNNGLYILEADNPPIWTTINWSDSASVINSFQGDTNSQASYIIEKLPSVSSPGQSMNKVTNVYRITARSVGANGAVIMLQNTLQIQQ
ncbi:pilus assembly protein [Legionella sainthelensi]|uniref:Pilus assembly protein PilX n=2 Tax=Legionella sainthelensi TaxID=28087 RepID=A0A2H5FQE3_9GAMM|nr:pilus assembly protein [Legionella sainthelensi]